jgi:hypothetical protein
LKSGGWRSVYRGDGGEVRRSGEMEEEAEEEEEEGKGRR